MITTDTQTEPPRTTTPTGLILRTCNPDMSSSHGFVWPRPGEDVGYGPGVAVAADWNPVRDCGYGLHGLLDGIGDSTLLNWAHDAVWMVVRPVGDELVDLDGKVKVRSAEVLHAGDRDGAIGVMRDAGALHPLPGDTATAGYAGTATAGYAGTATAGYAGTATAGNRGTATAGDDGTATAGYDGTATAGDDGTATAGYDGTATAGYAGTATAGYAGTATAGYAGTATAGDDGTATAGYAGTIVIKRWNGKRYKFVLGDIGETPDREGNPLQANVAYRLDGDGAFEVAS